jgi:DNA-binding transcriptional LysR family regulator
MCPCEDIPAIGPQTQLIFKFIFYINSLIYLMNVTLRQLRVLLEVARARSFTRTGGSIGLTQSAVSHSVRELETELGVKLFDRTTREVELTDAGKRLTAVLTPLLDELDRLLHTAQSHGEQLRGKVRVATSPTISANLMPACISECSRRHPDVHLLLRDQVQSLVMESVRQGEVDFGVVVEPKSRLDLACEPIMTDPFCLVCRADHPFAAKKSVRWTSLSEQNLVLLDHASGSRQLIDQALATHAVRSNVVQELGHPTTVFQMIAAGIGIAVLPMLAMPAPEASGLVVRALTPRIDRTIILARRKNRSLSPLAETVWQLIAEIARDRKPSSNF